MAEKDYSLPFMSAEVAKDKKNVDILTGSPLNTRNPTTLNEVKEDYYIYQYPNTIQDRLTDRDYKNTNSDIAAIEQGLEQVEDYPILNDIEFQADLEKIISGNVLTQVGLRALMEKTGGNLSKVLQNYTSNKELELDEVMGEVGSTGSPPDKTKEAPYDYNTRYVDDESNPLYLLNPKIRINLSDLADQDSALQTQWRKTKKDPTPDNLNSLRGLLKVSSYGNKNTPLSQANAISHELMHFAIIELYNKGLLDKATIEKLREDNSLSITGDNEIEELFISKMTKEKDLKNDPAFKGMFPSKTIFGDLKSKFNDTKLQNRIESAAETWLKTYSPPVQNQVAPEDQGNSFGRTSNTTPYTGKLPGRLTNSIIEEEMYDGAIPAGLAKGGDVGEGYSTDNYKQFRERNTPVSIEPNTDFINAIPKGLGSLNLGEILEESIPGVGETIIADSLADNIKNKEFKDAAIDGIALAMGVIPFVGDVASKSIRQLKGKKGTLEKPLNFKKAQKNKNKKELQDRVEVDIAERMKIYGQAEQSALNKFTDTFGGFGDLKVGDRIEGVTFGGTKTSHKIKGLTVLPIGGRLEGSEKRIKEYIKRYKTLHKEKIKQGIFPKEPTLIYDETSKITFRPLVQTIRNDGTEGGLYYDMISHKGINKFGIKKYAKGGDTMPMEQQMEMFAVGGLDDDGLSRDPVSGNEIPPGSMANEVRDDVEARLSDGEYVVPANVVRFFGVKFFEDLRTQAMQGLGAMEANGRIGGEPVPSDMPMQDQMAEVMPDVSDEEMQMLQGLMNEGGYVRGYAPGGAVVPKDADLENPTPFNPDPFSTVGASFFSPYNPNVTPDPNEPPTTMPVTPIPESGISFVTMVNPATGEIQLVQFMGGNPVDANAYNQLLSNGYFVQGSPELAAYKQRMAEDNRDPEPDTTTRPHPSEATISELGQLIAESSKGGGSLLEMIPGITGAVTGKLAQDHRNDITKALDVFIEKSTNVANKRAAEAMKSIWTNADLTSKQRKAAISKAGLYTGASVQNAMGKKAGKFGSKHWYGLTPQEEINKLFGSYSEPTFKIDTDTRTIINPETGDREEKATTDAERISDRLATGKGTETDKAAEAKRLEDYNRIMNENNNNDNDNDNNQGGGGGPISSTSEKAIDLAAAGSGNYGGAGGRAKGGLINKPTKKKKTKKY